MPGRASRNQPTGGGSPPHVLVVDDEKSIARLIERYLVRAGYAVTIAHSGQEALERSESRVPDVITLDLILPDMDGAVVLERIQGRAATARVPVIVVSIRGDEGDARLTGAFASLVKPLDHRLLLQTVAAAVASRA